MTSDEILKIIADNFLTVRRLPFKTISFLTYRDGDEMLKYVDVNGNPIEAKRTVIIQDFDLEHFKNTPPPEWSKNLTPEQRYERYKKANPNGRKLLREEKTVKNGGWYYVTKAQTSSKVDFSGIDVFKAPTLEGAIELYIKSKN